MIVLSQTVFFNYFFIVLYYKAFQSVNIKRTKGKECLFLVQYRVCSTVSNFLSELSVFAIKKRHFPFFRYHRLVVYEFSHLVSRKNTHKIVIYVRVINIFKSFFYLKVTNSPTHFFLLNKFYVFCCFFLCFFNNAVSNFRFRTFFTFLFLGPICVVRFTVTFRGKFHLLTLSYLAKIDCPLGSLTRCGVTLLLNTIFRLGI